MLHTHTHTQWNTHTHIHTQPRKRASPFSDWRAFSHLGSCEISLIPRAEDATASFLLLHLLREVTRDQSTSHPKGLRAPCARRAPPSLATPSRGDCRSVSCGRKGGGQQRSAPEPLCLCQSKCVSARTWANSKQPVRKQVLNNILHG